jgi:predicted XRE-type DNA-binding protein
VTKGHVFKDLALENARELAIKSDLVAAICRTITARAVKNQTEAAVLVGIDQLKVSKLIRGYFDEYSGERLLEFLAASAGTR